MEKRGRQKWLLLLLLVLLVGSGFLGEEVKKTCKKSCGDYFCCHINPKVPESWAMKSLVRESDSAKPRVTRVEMDMTDVQRENGQVIGQEKTIPENETEEALLQNDTAVQSENVESVPTAMSSGSEVYVNKLWETKDVKYLWDHFYIVDSTTSVRKKLFPVERLLKRNMTLASQKEKKQILIYHTHGASEKFADSRPGKIEDSVIGVGEELAKELEKRGYGTIHDKTKYDWMDGKIDRSKAYNASLEGVTRQLGENPDVQVVIDLHRDSVGKKKHTYTTIEGKKTAIVMFFNGMSRNRSGEISYLANPNREANLAFSLQLKCHAMELYDGFTKPIYLKGYRYNLHLKERALLIELGNENNTVEEAKNAAAPLAKVISDVLKGEVKHSSTE
ncbi:MAG: stage II sporulation protein P [Clostridiales bacterium]|nr:stage II sporulation protein P [Eubacterium sp.]MDD7349964.1 stage II sporulation protein P [Clostridiales bacterium]